MSTKTKTCIVRFIGGPSDGLVLSDSHFNAQDKVQMPATPAFVRSGQHSCCELAGWSTAYRLTCRHRSIEAGRATTRLRYNFLGYELVKAQVEHEVGRQRERRRLVGLRNWFSRVSLRLARWMLEPLDHPLKVPHEVTAPRQSCQ
jgi:hypothetical protein